MGYLRSDEDRYRRLSLLGEGGSGKVWLAEDRLRPGSRLALKETLPDRRQGQALLRREFVVLSRLRHPGVVEAIDLTPSSPDRTQSLLLEYVDGVDVGSAVTDQGPAYCLELAAEALRVLAYLHDLGLLHRDLKPGNLLVRKQPRLGCRLVFLDLGLAQTGERPDGAPTTPVGTLPYLAPELFRGDPASPRSDLYSLGSLLYEIVYGRPPHSPGGRDLTEFIRDVQVGRRPKRRPRGRYPKGFAGWIEELLATNPAHRPSEAREALARLNTACGRSFAEETAVSRAARLASDPPAGRDAEFHELWAMLESRGGSRVIWLLGTAGAGKSRLLRWVRTEAILNDWDVSAPLPASSLVPQDDGENDDGAAVLRNMRDRAKSRPTLILLDEVESADAATIRILDRIAREGRPEPLHIVAALRPGEVREPRLRRLLNDTVTVPTLRRVELEPLGAGAIRAIAERATASRGLSDSRVEWLLRTSEGNPLMVEALLVEGVWEKGGRGRRSRVLEHSVASRLALLSENGRTWLEALAALIRDAPEGAVATLSGLGPEVAREAAEECRLAGLARMEHGRWSPDSRTVNKSVMARVEEAARIDLLQRAAQLLSTLPAFEASPWRLARLWSAAGERRRARDCAMQAAAASMQRDSPERAAEQYAFALLQSQRGDPERLSLRKLQAAALMSAGRYQAAARAYGAALRLDSKGNQRTDLLGRQAHALVHAGRFARARASAEEALLRADGRQPLERIRAQQAIGIVLGRLGRESEALGLFEEVLAASRECGETEIEAEAQQNLATCKARLNHDDAEEDFRIAIELYRKLGYRGNELRCLVGLATIHMRSGQFERAGELLEDVRRRSAEHGQLDLLETALSKLASLFTEQGKLDRALTLAHEALDQARHLGDRNRLMIGRCRLAEALIGCGRSAKAVALLRDALADSTDQVEPDMIDSARMLLAHALLETPGATDEAVGEPLEQSLDGFRKRSKTRALLMALAIEMERCTTAGARDPFEPVHLEFESLAAASGEPEPEIRLRSELARGTFLLARGNPAQARDEARSAVRIAETAGLAAYGARAFALLGEALVQLGRKDEATEAFEAGSRLLDQAADGIEDPEVRQSFVERRVFRGLRVQPPSAPTGNDRRLYALYDMIRALNSENDPDALLEAILEVALRAVPTERGMILLRDPPSSDRFSIHLSRNIDDEQETRQDAMGFSRSIVAQAGLGRSILALDAGQDTRFRDLKSVSIYGIRSLMCVPLRSRGTVIGTVYLDSRKSGVLITPEDLRFIEAFADHAAMALQNARERAELLLENTRLQHAAETRVLFGNIVGRSPAMQRVFDLIEKVATSDLPVLIQGESGTGKELVARAVHFHGHRKRKIFVSENCAAIPESLLESELFGHVKGAFTGADRDHRGLFEQADGGTLFLDEVGDMSAGMQARLLRVLQEGELRRVGGNRPIRVNVRLITATHRELADEVANGRFREDLLYRLQVIPIKLPALRERPEDISPLIDHLLGRIANERGRPTPVLESSVRHLLERFSWPGNVRQLENTLQRLVLLAGDDPISPQMLRSDENFRRTLLIGSEAEVSRFSLEDAARDQLQKALKAAEGNRERAARLLGISRATIYRKIRDLGLTQLR